MISRPNATWPSTFQVQRRFIVQFGIAPAMNAVIEHTVVENPTTYRTANTIALVVAETIEEIANRAMRRPRIMSRRRLRRSRGTRRES